MRHRLVLWIDSLIVLAALLTLVIELTGGFHARIGGLRLSGRSPDRALLAVAGLVVARMLLVRGTGFLGVPRARWEALWRRVYRPAQDGAQVAAMRPAPLALAVVVICGMGAWLLGEQLRHLDRVPDLGDPLFSIWRMNWVFRQMLGDPRPLFDANIFHPERLTLTYSDSMLVPAITAAPLLLAGMHPVTVYNVLFLSGFLLSGVATYLLVYRLTASARAAIVAAVLYAFYPYRFEHYSHLELQMTHFMPLGLLALHRFWETLRLRHLLLAVMCAAAQLYSSMYYGVFFAIYAGVLGAVTARVHRVPWRRLVRPAAIAGTVGVLLALPLARPYVAAQARKGNRDLPAVRAYSATASDYFRAHERSARYGERLSGGLPERELFPGVMSIVLAAGALVPPVGGVTLAYSAGLLTAFDGSLGMNGLAYPYLYELFLPVRGLRVPARFSVLVGLSLAVLAGVGVARVFRRVSGWKGNMVLAALLVAIGADLQPVLTLEPVWREPPAVYDTLAAARISGPVTPGLPVIAEFPLPTAMDQLMFNLPYMYFSVWHGLPLMNGYSGFAPPDYEALVEQLSTFPDARSVRLLRERGVTHVTLNCVLHGPGCEGPRAAFGASPVLRHIVEREWEGEPVLLYELVAP